MPDLTPADLTPADLPADMTDGEKAYAAECLADGATVADAVAAARHAAECLTVADTQAAYARGKATAENMLQIGNVFQGSFNIADSLGYDRESLEWRCAVHGATVAIQAYGQIWTDIVTGTLVPAPATRIKLNGRIGGWQ